MSLIKIRADRQNRVSALNLWKSSGRSSNTESLLEPFGDTLVTLTTGMIDVFRAERLGDLLEHKELFVGQACSGNDAGTLSLLGLG